MLAPFVGARHDGLEIDCEIIGRCWTLVTRLLIFIGMLVGGYLGWWVGDYLDLGLMGVFLVSSLGSATGVCLGWKVGQDYFDS